MVDIKCSFPKKKYKNHERAHNAESQDDETLLRQSTRTFCEGFREAKKAFENGTDEVRQLLMQECSLIYECNICRNMFRNLANFVCHKRKYCNRKTIDEDSLFPDRGRNKFTIRTFKRSGIFPVKSRSTDSSPIPNNSSRDIRRVIERLKRVEVSNDLNCRKMSPIGKEKEICAPEPKMPESVLEIKTATTTTQSVYDTSEAHENDNSINTDLDNQKKFVCTGSKPVTPLSSPPLISEITCEICKIRFDNAKSLKLHVDKNHISTTYVFQCPTCTMTFLQPAAVIRHLANEHRKPLRRIRKMRDTILKKRIQIGDVQSKEVALEVSKFQLSNAKDKYSCSSTDNQNERCSYCSKIFSKKAAMAKHLLNCLAQNHRKDETGIQKQNGGNRSDVVPQINNSNSQNTIDEMFENLEKQTFGNGLHTVCLENIEMMNDLNESSIEGNENIKESESGKSTDNFRRNENDEKNKKEDDAIIRHKSVKKGKSKRFRVVSGSKQLTCRCKICNKQFNALSNLRRHISMFHYRSKRFGCNLCDYRAFRRYDIVNHLTFVHKMTGERESMAVEYVTVHEIKYSKNDVEGEIVLINEDAITNDYKRNKHQHVSEEQNICEKTETPLQLFENINENKKQLLKPNIVDATLTEKKESIEMKVKSQVKVVRKKLKKTLETQVEGKIRPIRNRIKTVNKDFVYDLLAIKEEPKQATHLTFKRSSTILNEQNNLQNVELSPPPVKIIPYRLRTEPLIPADKSSVKGVAENVRRTAIHDGLAAPSTLPELPTERPKMRSRLISASRSDLNAIPVIESSELEAAGLRSTFFDDSFLEKFAKKSNPSFKMKPLLRMQHSPLNSILQKFDTSQNNIQLTENNNRIPSNYSICLLESLTLPSLKDNDVTPNNKQVFQPSSPPATPKKRITLMERLAENRVKRRDSLIHSVFDN